MKKQKKKNISHFEAEIDNKISIAYLYAIESKINAVQATQLFKERYTEPTQINNIKPKEHDTK
ncbi:hypothetical protein KXQ82_01980 [Mucilaginibacter sp. HMF5004]|uniref:hypothetical protein n=1 Tax=Mucilaginibacter rivuli TaxID=2857527 RepID=UPI001C5F649A|nr:hypothetical protein [Mucilaginibacter rivuli]MBW4888459.1 hypothetical protein [Mucilaginibacter rivuli]